MPTRRRGTCQNVTALHPVAARVAIVLLNWRGWRDTVACLQSLAQLTHDSFAVFVIDNDSGDDSVAQIAAWLSSPAAGGLQLRGVLAPADEPDANLPLAHKQVLLQRSPHNGGFAFGNNLGLKLALQSGCAAFWLLNNDTVADPHALTALEQKLAEHADIGIVGSLLCYAHEPSTVQVVGGVRYNPWRTRGHQVGQGMQASDPRVADLATQPLHYVCGASMFVPRAFLDDVGLMEEGYFLYFEEFDWAARAAPRWRLATAAGSVVLHKEGGSIGTSSTGQRSLVSQFYLVRGHLLFLRRHKPWLLPLCLAWTLLDALRTRLRGQPRLASVTLRALAHGLAGTTGPTTVDLRS